jgi:peptidyl-prolyl cis-trans isomerase A (cyclophilin A)
MFWPASHVRVPMILMLFVALAGCQRRPEDPAPPALEVAPLPPPPQADAEPGDGSPLSQPLPSAQEPPPEALLNPTQLALRAPRKFSVAVSTTQGAFVVEVNRAWAPHGADRFYNLVVAGFFDEMRFHRVVKGALVQFGIHGHPAVSKTWLNARIEDDRPRLPNRRGALSFVSVGPHTRTTEVVINLVHKRVREQAGVVPFGRVTYGMEVVDRLNSAASDPGALGPLPEPARIRSEGDTYLQREFPKLDRIQMARITTGLRAS